MTEAQRKIHLACLILARGGSKGIPLKNLALVGGRPLITWSLNAAKHSGVFDSLWVSTDHEQIARIALDHGASVHQRSAEVSRDTSTSLETTLEFLKHHPEIDAIGLLQATSPCIQPDQLQMAADRIRNKGFDSAFSVVRNHFFRWKEVERPAEESTKALNFDPRNRPRRQDWNGDLCENGGFYFAKTWLIKDGLLQGGKVCYIEMPAEHSVDIDTPFDLLVADLTVKNSPDWLKNDGDITHRASNCPSQLSKTSRYCCLIIIFLFGFLVFYKNMTEI